MMRVAVIGAGNSGLAMSAHLVFAGNRINLWNRSEKTIQELKETKRIKSAGVLVGEFELDVVTADMEEALKDVKVILVTTPAPSHAGLARLMAPYLDESHIVILNPGRTFGAVDFKDELVKYGNHKDVNILETQTIIYTCRKTSGTEVNIIALKREVLISTFKGKDIDELLRKIPDELNRFYKKASSMVETSIGNVGMILHCAPMLLNAGWIESAYKFLYYREAITPSIIGVIEKLDKERLLVADALNHPVVSVKRWMKISYNLKCDTLLECIQSNPSYDSILAPDSLGFRYIYEDIPYGLVPLESMGKDLGIDMKTTTLIIDLANTLLNEDFRAMGRTAEKLHIDYKDLMKGVSTAIFDNLT